MSIEGFDEDLAGELRNRAHNYLAEKEEEYTRRRRELGVADDLIGVAGLSGAMLVALGEAGIKTRDDLADLAADELNDRDEGVLREFGLSMDEANAIIMSARAHWFEDEEPAEDGGAEEETATGA
jgi:N utilization substance protein A